MKRFAVVAALAGVALASAGAGIAQLIPPERAPAAAAQLPEAAVNARAQAASRQSRLYASRRVHERSAGPGNW